ncbi:hypothetical protein VE02_02495 [Pseudogymnoascus sp. 03VT05]|nr:hypothetical protein VE02_02495 [Pseudogymnoascus sp. 03VT05]
MAEAMNPDFMEYQMDIDDPTITSSQAMAQPTCPYRPTANTPNALAAFQASWSYNPHMDPNGPPSGSSSNPGGVYWAGMPSHNSPQPDSSAGGPSRQLSHSGHPGSAARYSLPPFNRTPDFAGNQQRFVHPEENRHPIPRVPDMGRFHNANENRQGESQNAGPVPPVASGVPNHSSPADEITQRRNAYMQAQMARSQQEAQSNRNTRQPPTLTVQSTFFPTHLPQPNFTGSRSPSHFQGVQAARGEHSSFLRHAARLPILRRFSANRAAVEAFQYTARNISGPPPPAQPPRQLTQFEQEQRRAWIHEANLVSDYGDESDDDSLDSFNQRDLGVHARHSLAHGQRRPAMSTSEGEERELAMERSRAARRAAIAAAKLVASPAALASLEPVELSSLTGDDRNCIICYNEFGIKNPDGNIESAVRLPKCKHVFGDHCLKHWLKDSDSCPYCRDKLPSEPKKSPAEEMRRLFILNNRPATSTAQHHIPPMTAEERAAAFAAMEHRHLGQAYMHRAHVQSQIHALYALEAQNRARLENAALEQSEAIMRRNIQRQEEWAAMQQQHSHGAPHATRPMPDNETRRRNRRNSTRNSSGNNGGAAARFLGPAAHRSVSTPNPNPNPNPSSAGPGANSDSNSNANSNSNSRPPAITTRNIFDTANTVAAALGQPRSVTPHPSVLENGGATPASLGSRRSSLPADNNPIRDEARDMARAAMLGMPPLPPLEGGDMDMGTEQVVVERPMMELFGAEERVWTGGARPDSEGFLGGGFQAGVMDGGARRWGGARG